jgi:hypothetical protein
MKKLLMLSMIIIFTFSALLPLAKYSKNTDFPAYYRTAKIIADPTISNKTIYDYDLTANQYDYPNEFIAYKYSMLVAYLMAPFAYLSYNTAKAVMMSIIILSYIGGVVILLRLLGAKGRWFFYSLAGSFLWLPFLKDLGLNQTDSIIFFLIAAGIYFAVNKQPTFCGALIGFACLFKVFPLAIALVLGLKNWRITASCIGVFASALLLPGTPEWFTSFLYQPFHDIYYTPVLKLSGHYCFMIVAATITLATAIIAYLHREADYIALASLAAPAMFLVMPILEWFHFTILIISYLYIIMSYKTAPKHTILLTLLSVLIIIIGGLIYRLLAGQILLFTGLLCLWLGMIVFTMHKLPSPSIALSSNNLNRSFSQL